MWRTLRRGLAKKAGKYKPVNAFDDACYYWLGIPAVQASRIVVIGVAVGAMMETFMIKVWIGKTNCARRAPARDV
jgi:hypothetical protein